MARFLNVKKEHIGLSPDSFHFKGERKVENVLLRVIDLSKPTSEELDLESPEDLKPYLEANTPIWVNVDGLHDEQIMIQIGKVCGLDSVIISDVLDTESRPRMQEYDDAVLLSFNMLKNNGATKIITVENVALVMKRRMIITFQEQTGDVFNPLRERIKKNKNHSNYSDIGYLTFSILDIVFDNYNYILSEMGEEIEANEYKLLDHQTTKVLKIINAFKKEIIFLRKSILPCQEMISDLIKTDYEHINNKNMVHFRELKTNIRQTIDSLDNYREILSDQLNIYHNSMSSKLNDTIKFLTVFSTIFIPLTLITGIYGTNFDNVPELHLKYGYYVMWGIMLTVSGVMLMVFRKKKWI